MQRKVGAGSVAVTREEVKGALDRTKTLSSEEEKVLRMRYGAGAETARSAPLPRAAGGNAALEDELLVIEMQLHKAMRMRMAQERAGRNEVAQVSPQPSRTKEKIARALRRKK